MELLTLEAEAEDLLVKALHSVLVDLVVEVEVLYLLHQMHNLEQMVEEVEEVVVVIQLVALPLMELTVEMELL
jgi:hypothetical protein